MNIAADFVYRISPYLRFEEGGQLDLWMRDTPRRLRKEVLWLEGWEGGVGVVIQPASEGRVVSLEVKEAGSKIDRVDVSESWGGVWRRLGLRWGGGELTVFVDGEEHSSIAFEGGFSPEQIQLNSLYLDEIFLRGNGTFRLNWEEGYAAEVEAGEGVSGLVPRAFGFDTYVISLDSETREFPMMQVSNAGVNPSEVSLDFQLKGERTGLSLNWSQTLSVEGGESMMAPIEFPVELDTDVYHLYWAEAGSDDGFSDEKHFFYVEPRGDLPGPGKFGFHDSNNRRFGSWPDPLGIDFAHAYSYWSYIVGPAWIKDFNGEYGLDPATPAEEWAWNPRVDWHLGHGLTVYLSLQSEPFQDWMRDYEYPEQKMKEYDWGRRGGFPRMDLYRDFVREAAKRYKGKVDYYEIENEPNAGGKNKIPPEAYVEIAKAVYEEINAIDSEAMIYGICGTGTFEPWMEEVFESGGNHYMDGVSIHTYVTPSMPEPADLPGKLESVQEIIESTGMDMPVINSETGTYVALREVVDRPISEERLKELIDQGTRSVFLSRGWPNYAVSERQGSISIVRNAVYNFASGTERFVFFGWNPDWPILPEGEDWAETGSANGFSLISLSRDGIHTPSWQTLAIGVMVEQLRSARLDSVQAIDQGGVRGAIFPTQAGGETAVLWSPLGKRTVLLKVPTGGMEVVDLFGKTLETPGAGTVALEIGEEPMYLHLEQAGLSLGASPVLNLTQENRPDGKLDVSFSLVNRNTDGWTGQVRFPEQEGWTFEPAEREFSLDARSVEEIRVIAIPPQTGSETESFLTAELSLPDGGTFSVPMALKRRPMVTVNKIQSEGFDGLMSENSSARSYGINRPEQVVVGRPPKLTSIQEDQFWKGPDELSATIKLGYNESGFFIYADVVDSEASVPKAWPGVRGSAVEIFFDLRSAEDGFGSGMGEGVYQVVLRPALSEGDSVEIWNTREDRGVLEGTVATGGPTEKGYWIGFFVPWESLERDPEDFQSFGFDIGFDGPNEDGSNRKNQIMLMGSASNSSDASHYGVVLLEEE